MSKFTEAFEKGEGVLRMVPTFVPRNFSKPGHRLQLHPDDYWALGTKRGAMKERWFSSVAKAGNGPLAAEDEGLSYVAPSDNIGDKLLFKDLVGEIGADVIGQDLLDKYGTWPMYSKYFDYNEPLFHHLHLTEAKGALAGTLGKPESYYFPRQRNNHLGNFPVTYFGFDPDVTLEEVRQRMLDYEKKDTRITELSRAYRIQLGTGWYTPAGVVHAPGSVLTYEPQWNADCNSVYENVTAGEVNPFETLNEFCPEDKKRDMDYILSLMEWDLNVDPHYRKTYFRPPVSYRNGEGYQENWISYGNEFFGAKELTIEPGAKITIKDNTAYGCILQQGHGTMGVHDCETAVMLRFGRLSADEFFVSAKAAKEGIVIENKSKVEPLVILKHFGPNDPEMPR